MFFKIISLFFVFIGCCGFVSEKLADEEEIVSVAKENLDKCLIGNAVEYMANGLKWEGYLNKMRLDIPYFKTTAEAILYAQSKGQLDFDHRGVISLNIALALEKSLREEFPHFASSIPLVADSIYSDRESLLYYNGRWVSDIFYYHYRYVLQCLTYVDKPKVICEIGGGYGGSCRLWMVNAIHTPEIYILLDFPECLFFAENFLKANFQEKGQPDVIHIANIEFPILPSSFKKKTIILCPIGKENLLKLLPIDLVINTGSIQEMTEEWVDYWMRWLNESNIRYFYSLNYFARRIDRRTSECATVYAPRLSNEWRCLLNIIKRPFYPAFHYPDFAEIIAEKNGAEFDSLNLKSRFDSLINKPFDDQRFLDCMDILRFCPEQEMVWKLICKIFAETPSVPQESLYLVRWLLKNGTSQFLVDKKVWLDEKNSSLSKFLN